MTAFKICSLLGMSDEAFGYQLPFRHYVAVILMFPQASDRLGEQVSRAKRRGNMG